MKSLIYWCLFVVWCASAFAANSSAFNVDSLKSLLAKNPATGVPVQTLEELIPLLPKELRSNFTFIYQSRSPHGGLGDETKNVVSYEFPRLVLFSADSRLILAFTGNPNKAGYDQLEVSAFDDQTASFKFSQYILPAAVKRDPNLASLAMRNGETNPAECLRCHGADPRPVTDSYPLWPGFYGSVRDTFPKGSVELPFYKKFIKAQKSSKSGVYRQLNWPKGTSVPPFLDPKKYNPNTVEAGLDEFKFLPNTRLGMGLTELNRKRIQRKIQSSPHYEKYKYALLSGFLGCSNLNIDEQNVNSVYQELALENSDRLKRLGSVPVGPGSTDLNMMEIGFYGNVVQLVYLAKVLEVDRTDWSMAFEPNSLSYFDGILSSIVDGKDFYLKEDILFEMLKALSVSDPAFLPYFRPYAAYASLGYPFGERLDLATALGACGLLAERTRARPVTLPPISSAQLVDSAVTSPQVYLQRLHLKEAPYARCTTCHEGEKALFTSRKIPFTSPAELKVRLGQKSSGGEVTLYEEIMNRVKSDSVGQMPPHGERLNEGEISNLAKYLNEVMKS